MDKAALITKLCPPLDKTLTSQFIDEYNSLESRYVLRDWEPATLDCGQFAEVASRILYHIDSGTLDHSNLPGFYLDYVDDIRNHKHHPNSHSYPDRLSAMHTSKVIRMIYKFRSSRGAVHITPGYSANHLDASFVVSNAKWVLSEFLRIFLSSDPVILETTIRDILEYSLPVIGDFDGKLVVQRTDLHVDEEVLILLHYAGSAGFSRKELGRFVQKQPPDITKSLNRLKASNARKIVELPDGNFRLSPLGNKFVLKQLADKLKLED